MNENISIIDLRDFTDGSNPYGTARGRKVHAQLIDFIDSKIKSKTIGISLKRIEGADVSFLRECLIYTFKRYAKQIAFFVRDIADEDIIDNLNGAALSGDYIVTCWTSNKCFFVGPKPSESSKALLDAVTQKRSATTVQIAQALDMSVQNASTRLKRLSEDGFLVRAEMTAESGGKEFVYHVIGNSA